jgi:hypothetical protein
MGVDTLSDFATLDIVYYTTPEPRLLGLLLVLIVLGFRLAGSEAWFRMTIIGGWQPEAIAWSPVL